MGVIEKAVAWAIDIANDNRHGYSQANRWGPDYDCSSLVIAAYEQAGVPVKSRGATYTGNMRSVFTGSGFVDVTYSIGRSSGYGLQAGDVLLNDAAHACLYIGGGQVVNARTDEGHPQSGDQSGQEIRIQNYWDFPWSCVLRYKGSNAGGGSSGGLRKGSSGEEVRKLQQKLIDAGYDVGPDGADGIFGNNTFRAVVAFQEDHGIDVTGEAGPETMEAFGDSPVQPEPVQDDQKEEESGLILPDLSTGDRGAAVSLLQAALNVRGFDSGTVDGEFGPKTQAALNNFKREIGLTSDGRADASTWDALLRR